MPLKFKPKKELGQVFLKNEKIKEKMLKSMSLNKEDVVLEIGAGKGELTCEIAKLAKFVYAVELDPILCKMLEEEVNSFQNIKILNEDILNIDLEDIYKECGSQILVVGNIPFSISTPLLLKLVEERRFIKESYLTFQKEVALKLKARHNSKEYGFLACYFNVFCDIEILFFIGRRNFTPPPKVDSAFLHFKFYKEPKFFLKSEKMYLKFLRICFNQRRKKIKNVLKKFICEKELTRILKELSLNENVRSEQIPLEKYPEFFNLCFDFLK